MKTASAPSDAPSCAGERSSAWSQRLRLSIGPAFRPHVFRRLATIIEGVMIGVFVAAVIFTAIIFISF